MASASVSNPSPMALTFVKRRDGSFPPRSHRRIENAEAALSVLDLRILQIAIDHFEGARACSMVPRRSWLLNPLRDLALADRQLFETQRDIVRFRQLEWLIVVKADRSPPLTLRAQPSEPVNKEILP
jgi:hypothetical protein